MEKMGHGKLWICPSSALRLAQVLAMAQLLSFAQSVHYSQTADSPFCDRFAVPFGYNCRQYMTHTTDGYLLVAHHISNQPRRTSQPRSGSSTVEAPAPFSPLCVSTVEKPFETVHDFVRDSSAPQSSKTSGVKCYPLAPIPSILSDDVDGQLEDKTTVDRLDAASLQGAQRGGVNEEDANYESSSTDRPRVDEDRNETTPDSSIPTSPSVTATSSRTTSVDALEGNHGPASKPKLVHLTIGQTRRGSMERRFHKPSVGSNITPETTRKSSPSSTRATKRRYGSVGIAHSHTMTTQSASPSDSPKGRTTDFKSSDAAAPLSESQPDSRKTPGSHSPSPPSSPGRVSATGGAQPVLLMHQEFQNGNSWFVNTDDESDQLLPFLLLNSGFDVWIGHQRATYYGHGHATLTPDNQSYWNWSWDEHAKYDMPALLELVHRESGSTVHLVGISQSATVGAAVATMPSASSLLKSLTLIGPTIYRGNTTSHTLAAWASLLPSNMDRTYYNTPLRDAVFNLTNTYYDTPLLDGVVNLIKDLFTDTSSSQVPIATALDDISGPNCCLGSTVVKFDNGWDGTTSCKNMLHYQQGIRTNTWSHFDHANNSKAYHRMPLPPTYNPEDILATLPVLVIYGGQDKTAPPAGCRDFLSRLRNHGGNNSAVFLPAYAHFDLLYSLNRTQDVFIPVLQFLEKQRSYNDTLPEASVVN